MKRRAAPRRTSRLPDAPQRLERAWQTHAPHALIGALISVPLAFVSLDFALLIGGFCVMFLIGVLRARLLNHLTFPGSAPTEPDDAERDVEDDFGGFATPLEPTHKNRSR